MEFLVARLDKFPIIFYPPHSRERAIGIVADVRSTFRDVFLGPPKDHGWYGCMRPVSYLLLVPSCVLTAVTSHLRPITRIETASAYIYNEMDSRQKMTVPRTSTVASIAGQGRILNGQQEQDIGSSS